MSETLCPTHNVPMSIAERVDPRLTATAHRQLEWFCPAGQHPGHFVSRNRVKSEDS